MNQIYSDALSAVLAKRRTEKEVYLRLVKKGYNEDEAKEAAHYYRELGYIDNADYARRFTYDAAQIKGQGPLRIRRDLKERGVEEEYIDKAINETEFCVAKAMERKFGKGFTLDMKTAKKITNHFMLKGFYINDIKNAMKDLYGKDVSFE